MSLLRRKGKKERRNENKGAYGAELNRELLSGDIFSLLRVFHSEANIGKARDESNDQSDSVSPETQSRPAENIRVRAGSNRKPRKNSVNIRPSSPQYYGAASH